MSNDPQAQDLGRLEGIVEMLRDQHQATQDKLDCIRADVTSLKVEAGKQGAAYGGVMAIGVALIIEGAKGWLNTKGFKSGGGA